MGERNGFDPCDAKLVALDHELGPIMRAIMSTPARSIAGLRVKTLAAIEANGRLWDETPRDLDYDAEAVRSLIEAACAYTGVPVPKEPLSATDDGVDDAQMHPGSAAVN